MNKVISNFYLIRLDDKPVYVGYTNRPIKTRFSEHLKDKDFGGAKATLEGLGGLEYNFTWDMNLINSYSREVSDRETELIWKYGTQDSVWQKGLGTTIGGQTWANVKHFVRTNRDNPKFRSMSETDIIEYLETSNRVSRYMQSFVSSMDDPVAIYMKSFVGSMDDPVAIYMKSFVNHMDDPVAIYMGSFVSNMDDPVAIYMKNFVNHVDDPVAIYMKNFVNHVDDPVAIYMKNFVGSINDPVAIYMKNYVRNMDDPVAIYMKSFVGNMKKPLDS